MMRSFLVLSLCLFLSFSSVSSVCIQGGVVPDCNSDSYGLRAVWNSVSCRFECPKQCPATTSKGSPYPFKECAACAATTCAIGTTCYEDRCGTCKAYCVPNNPTTPPAPPTVAPTQCAFGTTIQELRSNTNFEISSPAVVHTLASSASLLPSSQAQLLNGIDGFSTLPELFAFVEDGKISQFNVMYKPTSEMYVLYTYSAGENNHGWINPAAESYRVARIGDESMYECRVPKVRTCGERGLGCSVMDCGNNRQCDEDSVTCTATCKPISTPKPTPTPTTGGVLCPQVCKPMTCPGYEEIVRVCDIKVINNACTWVCPAPPTTTPTPVPGRCATNEGGYVTVGQGYRSQCNSCTCQADGMGMCTKMGCIGKCWDNNGKAYQDGETRTAADGGCCTCGENGKWSCTRKACPPPPTTESPECSSCAVMFCAAGTFCTEKNGCGRCEPRMCAQGGARPTECPGEEQSHWDSVACRWVCNTECQTCAATSCLKGTTCIEKNCVATCEPNVCEDKCALVRCRSGECVMDSSCETRCVPSGTVVLTLSFTLRWSGVQKAKEINKAMSNIAQQAGVANQFVIHNIDIQQLAEAQYGPQRWSVKVGFKGQTYADRKFALYVFYFELQLNHKIKDASINAANNEWGFTNQDTIATATETMSMQTCADGSEMSVEQQCPMVDVLIVPTSTSSSSTPIAVIIAPIVAGIVLITVIATAIIIIRRRRLNTIKTMDRMETQMTPNPAITSQV